MILDQEFFGFSESISLVPNSTADLRKVICQVMADEFGTANEQFSTYMSRHDNGQLFNVGDIECEVVDAKGEPGILVRPKGGAAIGVRRPGVVELANPKYSLQSVPGKYEAMAFFPITIAKIAAKQGLDLVYLPKWAERTFLSPDRKKRGDIDYYYEYSDREGWRELPRMVHSFALLLERHQLPFFSTHDLIQHVANFKSSDWDYIDPLAVRARRAFEKFFEFMPDPNVESLIFISMLGVVLDTVAQPPFRDRRPQIGALVDTLLRMIESNSALATIPSMTLRRFPQQYADIIALSLNGTTDADDFKRQANPLFLQLFELLQVKAEGSMDSGFVIR